MSDTTTLSRRDAESLLHDLENRYDGAPDSSTLWMGWHIDRLEKALAALSPPPPGTESKAAEKCSDGACAACGLFRSNEPLGRGDICSSCRRSGVRHATLAEDPHGGIVFPFAAPTPAAATPGMAAYAHLSGAELNDGAGAAEFSPAAATPAPAGEATERMMTRGDKQALRHGRNCPAGTPGHDEECTCGLKWRDMLATEQTMHAAWRKRAEEAEAQISAEKDLRDHVAAVVQNMERLAKECRKPVEQMFHGSLLLGLRAALSSHGAENHSVNHTEKTVSPKFPSGDARPSHESLSILPKENTDGEAADSVWPGNVDAIGTVSVSNGDHSPERLSTRPVVGDYANCKTCGEPIRWLGQYWRHTDSSPAHDAMPAPAQQDAAAEKGDHK